MPADDCPRADISRRSLFALAGGVAVTLVGCGSSNAPPGPLVADAAVLDTLLAVGNRAVAAYAHVTGLLGGAQRALTGRIGVQEAAHVYALTGAIANLGASPAPGTRANGFPARDARAALALAAEIEDMSIAACIDAMPKLSNLAARAIVVSIANNDAQHAVLIAQARGLPAVPNAVVRGRA